MSSRCLSLLLALPGLVLAADPPVLRVCADPNNLPFSNQRGEGFENRLAELIAHDLGVRLEYEWWSQRRSFLKRQLGAGVCDAVMGVPSALDSVALTRPYYRSTYVSVSRKDRNLHLTSLFDSRLAALRIGVHMVGDDYAPPGLALGERGLAANVTGFSLYGPYGEENPPARLIHAVAAGDVDVAFVWGPLAGYFASRQSAALQIEPVSPPMLRDVPFTFEISIAVREGDEALKKRLDAALERNCAAVHSLLEEYGVPQLAMGENNVCGSPRQLPVLSR